MKRLGTFIRGLRNAAAVSPDSIRHLQKRVSDLEAMVDILMDEDVDANGSGALNGQEGRQQIVGALATALSVTCVMETGTFLGVSTAYFARTLRVPVYSTELDRRYYLAARRRLRGVDGVHLVQGDSRAALRVWREDSRTRGGCSLFYLDAHGGADLPLLDEIEIIVQAWESFVIVIDDFQVPWDAGYGYDDYGPLGGLKHALIDGICRTHHLASFYPTLPSAAETGVRQGCVVIVPLVLAKVLRDIPLLREYVSPHLPADPPSR